MPERVDWFYQRQACRTSRLAQRFLTARGCAVVEVVDADAATVDAQAAVALVRSARKLVAAVRGYVLVWELAEGKYFKFRSFHPRGRTLVGWNAPGGIERDERVRYAILNSAGSLRTPALRKGGVLLVGFSAKAARRVFHK